MASDVCNSKIRRGGTLSPSPSPSMGRGIADPLELIAEGKHSIDAVCIESGMSILELAEHVCTPRNLEALGRVARLHAIEREMLLGKLKRDALVRLAKLTDEVPAGSADEIRAFEVMRRACRDLLRSGGWDTEKRSSRPGGPGGTREYPGGGYHPEPLTPAFEAEVLEALERLGEEANQYEPGTHVSESVASEVEVTQEVQVGMAFGKTSDHGNESRHTGKPSGPPRRMPMPPVQEGPLRTGKMPMPLEETPPETPLLQPLRAQHRPIAGSERQHGGCRAPPHSAKM